jgi:hypothetical protein
MKNIHLLPTEKTSRLWYNSLSDTDELLLSIVEVETSNNQHIYITSDEEIKEDYVFAYGVVVKVMMFDEKTLYFVNGTKAKREDCKKIILTTDQDLIADGVQAIDDEFLEWFIKNPSFESAEVREIEDELISHINPKIRFSAFQELPSFIPTESLNNMILTYKYKIIIPQEEPNQETVEEAAVKYAVSVNAKMGSHKGAYENCSRLDFIAGTKWESERGYNEQIALINWLQQSLTAKKFYSTDAEDLIEQFKRK